MIINLRTGCFHGAPRNKGIELAAGEYIIYIDNDDYWGEGYLQGIADEIGDLDWAYFNDWVLSELFSSVGISFALLSS